MSASEHQWDPKNFEETSQWAKFSAYDALQKVDWQGDEVVLDVGTGDGKIAAYMALQAPKGSIVGIDPSETMIVFAKEHYPSEKFSNLHFVIGSAITYQPKEHFDLITSFTALHLEPNQKQALQHFSHWLKLKGKLLLKFPIGDGFAGALEETIHLPQWSQYFKDFHSGWYFSTKEDYENFLSDLGFQIVCIENQTLDECYNSPTELGNAVRVWLPHIQKVPLEKQDLFLEELLRDFLQRVPPDEHGKVHHYEPTLFVEAINICNPNQK